MCVQSPDAPRILLQPPEQALHRYVLYAQKSAPLAWCDGCCRAGGCQPSGRTERSGVNSSRPILGRLRGTTFTCDSTPRFATCGQNGEPVGLVPPHFTAVDTEVSFASTEFIIDISSARKLVHRAKTRVDIVFLAHAKRDGIFREHLTSFCAGMWRFHR